MLKDVSFIVTAAIEILLPIILAIIIWKKFKVSWTIFFLGMIFFLISLSRIPLNNYLGSLLQSNFSGELFYILFGVMAGITAGIFEEGLRIIAIGAVIKQRDYFKGIMYGIGHGGGGEAMFYIGFTTLANYIIYKFFPNIFPINIIPQMDSMVWYLPLMGALERVLAIAIQIAFSVLVMHAFIYRKYYIIPLVIIFHAAIDFIAYYFNYKFGVWYAELAVFLFAVIGIILIISLRPKKYKHAVGQKT